MSEEIATALGIALRNTAARPCLTIEEAKADCRAYVESALAAARGGEGNES